MWTKVVPALGPDEPVAMPVKVARRGLVGADLRAFVKRAGHRFLPDLKQLRPGEVPVHLIAMGSTECYGPNRNGDGFKRATLERALPTFETHAWFFQDHDNTPHSPRYGRIIKAAYNREMGRGELLVALWENEDAAKAGHAEHGRPATRSLEKLARGQDLAVSMSCRVPFDVCSGCGNKAAGRHEYCDEWPRWSGDREIPACPRGGCRTKLAQLCPDGHVLHVDNPDPGPPRPLTFIDMSDVDRPADRTAFALGIVPLEAAS